MTINEHKINVHFDNEFDVHISSENHEENGYVHKLDLLIILH
jgi:hypothetical protein